MAKYLGNDLAVSYGATTVTPANLIKSVEVNRSAETHESSGAGDADKTFLAGKKSATVKIDAWDDAAAATLRAIFVPATSAELDVYPQGNSSGKPKLAMTAIVTDLTLGIPNDGVCPVSISLLVSGAITETVIV